MSVTVRLKTTSRAEVFYEREVTMANRAIGKITQDFVLVLELCIFGMQEAELPLGDVLPRCMCRLRRWRMLALLV